MKQHLRKVFLALLAGVLFNVSATAQDYVYTNDLRSAGDATVVGAGTFVSDATFGTVYQNVMDEAHLRSNYLLLPQDVLSHSTETKQMTIAFWVSAEGFTPDQYIYVPLFTAYAMSPAANAEAGHAGNVENWPIFYAQSRGPIALNNDGYCDFGSELNVAGKNAMYNTNAFDYANFTAGGNWLEDQKWHYYTLVLTETNVKCYLDGEIKNEWNVDNTTAGQVMSGFFTYGGNYKHICLGGNQAFDWGDPDSPFKYAKLRIQNNAMTAEDIAAQMEQDKTTTIVGKTDNTTEWWTAFSDYYTIEPNKTLKLEFKNYSDKVENSHNWLAVVTTDAERGQADYSEYVALRADNWAWQGSLNTGVESTHDWYTSLTSNYSWDYDGQTNGAKFRDEMDGSDVVMTITRLNETVTIHADITAQSGEKYYEEFVINCGDGTQNIRAFLTVEGGHLILDNDATTITDTEMPPVVPEGLIGNEDNTTAWWSAFSDYYTIEPNKTLKLEFKNYSDKVENSHNWLAVVTTDAERGQADYSEYVALRADNWAWQYSLNTGPESTHDWFTSLTSNYSWDYDGQTNSAKFRDEMDGSDVVMTITRLNETVTIHADITAQSGEKYYEEFVINCGDGTQDIRAFLTVEGGHLILDNDATTITDTGKLEGQVGETDYTTPIYGDHSDILELTDGKMATFEFSNYSNTDFNWHSWVACVANSNAVGAENAIIVLRNDNFEEKQYSNEGIYSNFSWDYPEEDTGRKFREEMDGANVKATVKFKDGRIIIRVDIASNTGANYFEEFVKNVEQETVYTYITVNNSYLVISKAEVTALPVIPENYVGYEDNTSIYLEDFSDVLTLTEGKIATFEFTNYSDKFANWHNWVVCVGGETFSAADLKVALRADKWENVQGSNSGITSDFNFDTDDMDGAKVVVTVTYKEGKAVIHADITTADNKERSIEFTKEGLTGTITAAMSIDHAHLVMTKAEVTNDPASGISTIDAQNATQDAPMFDLSGRRVDASYKGIVIQNGKKMIVK